MQNSILEIYNKEKKLLKELEKYYFEVGVFEDKAQRKKKKRKKQQESKNKDITNLELMAIHEYGSPVKGIPKRPILKITITHNKINKYVEETIERCEDIIWNGGTEDDFVKVLKQAALYIESFAKELVMTGKARIKANKPATIKAKKSSLPLIDTGELIKSIVCVVNKHN